MLPSSHGTSQVNVVDRNERERTREDHLFVCLFVIVVGWYHHIPSHHITSHPIPSQHITTDEDEGRVVVVIVRAIISIRCVAGCSRHKMLLLLLLLLLLLFDDNTIIQYMLVLEIDEKSLLLLACRREEFICWDHRCCWDRWDRTVVFGSWNRTGSDRFVPVSSMIHELCYIVCEWIDNELSLKLMKRIAGAYEYHNMIIRSNWVTIWIDNVWGCLLNFWVVVEYQLAGRSQLIHPHHLPLFTVDGAHEKRCGHITWFGSTSLGVS